jgi:allantoate deiminase
MAMLFVRCQGGISHSPQEFVAQEDVAAAVAALYTFFQQELL